MRTVNTPVLKNGAPSSVDAHMQHPANKDGKWDDSTRQFNPSESKKRTIHHSFAAYVLTFPGILARFNVS